MRPDANRSILRYLPVLLPLLWGITLLPGLFGEERAIGVDPANYLLGMRSYSIAQERPHPPGYPVFIALARAASVLTGGDHAGLRLVVILFALAAVLLTWRLGRRWGGPRVGAAAAMLLALNPLFWFYACTSESYAVDAAVAPALILLLLATRRGGWIWTGLAVGLALGLRSTTVVLLAPALLPILWLRVRRGSMSPRDLVVAALGAVAGLAVWLPWVIVNEGGWSGYLRALDGLTTRSAGPFIGNLAGLVITLLWCAGPVAFYWLLSAGRIARAARNAMKEPTSETGSARAILLLWAIVPTLFFALVIHTKGYLLLVLPALAIGTAWLAAADRRTIGPARLGRMAIIAIVLVGAGIFLLIPSEPPPAYAALAPRNRTSAERARSVLGRALSAYLPARSEIAARDRELAAAVDEIASAVGTGFDTTLVLIDPAGSTYAHPRILQCYLPRILFALPGIHNDRLLTFFRGDEKWKRFGEAGVISAPRILLFTDRGLAAAYPMMRPLAPRGAGSGALLEGEGKVGPELRVTIDSLFTRWDQPGEGPPLAPPPSATPAGRQ